MGDNRSDWTSQEIWQGFQIVDAPAKSDELAAAERAVVEAAEQWYHRFRRDFDPELTNAVAQMIRLRAAQDSQGSGG